MTRAEVTEIFAVLMMAYPNAEMFKAPDKDSLKAKLAPTITLLALIHLSEPTRLGMIPYAVFCLKKKNKIN